VSDKAYLQHLSRGGELLRADRVDEARIELEAASRLKPNDPKILNLLGLAYFRLGSYDPAVEIYRELADRQPTDAGLRLNLGLVYLKQNRVDDAILELSKANKLDPAQLRTVGYLGLAYARKGEYARARDAFVKAGQEELAKEMAQYLAESSAPTEGASAAGSGPLASDSAVGLAVAAVTAHVPEAGPAPESPGAVPPEASGPVVSVEQAGAEIEDEGVESAAPPSDEPTGGPEPTASAEEVPDASPIEASALPRGPRGAPVSVTAFATGRLIRPDDGDEPFEVAAGNTLIVRVRGRILSRTEGVVVSGGELAYEPATKRVRGRVTEEPFGSEDRPMFIVSGVGHLVAMPRGSTFSALHLADDIVYLREDLVFAFEERLGWENGHVPGSAGDIPVVQLRGEGCVAIRTRRPPLSVKLAAERILYVDADVLAGWIGRVVPRVVAPVAGGDASAPFVECTGEGVVLVEEPGPPEGSA
jgi:Flp pilus assembly protein TadD/uncharacterized protein (AIM24 family)